MNNNEISKNLKALKSIKPDNDWVLSTKAFILEPEHTFENNVSRGFLFKLQPALVIPMIMFIIAGSGIGLHFAMQSPDSGLASGPATTYLAMAEEKLGQPMDAQGVKEISDILDKATTKLAKAPKDTTESATIVEHISSINKKVEELAIEELVAKAQVLTSVAKESVESKIDNTTQALVENLIKILEIRELSENQKELFTQANIDYNNKNYSKALETILILTNE